MRFNGRRQCIVWKDFLERRAKLLRPLKFTVSNRQKVIVRVLPYIVLGVSIKLVYWKLQ